MPHSLPLHNTRLSTLPSLVSGMTDRWEPALLTKSHREIGGSVSAKSGPSVLGHVAGVTRTWRAGFEGRLSLLRVDVVS